METTTTRYLGKCPICEGDFKLTADTNVLVHHGYRRPGDGMIHGDCYAVHYPPYEVSCEVTKKYLGIVEANRVASEKRLKALESGEVTELTEVSLVSREIHTFRKGDAVWPQKLRYAISEVKYRITNLKSEETRLTKLIDNWAVAPIRTLEEETTRLKAEADQRKASKGEEKAKKLQEKIEGYQKRIDSGVRNQNASSLRDIFESITYNLPHKISPDTSKRDAVKKVDRDHVWTAMGFLTATGEIDPKISDIYHTIYRDTFEWPAVLGAPKKGKGKKK